jgi:hypothetical protein
VRHLVISKWTTAFAHEKENSTRSGNTDTRTAVATQEQKPEICGLSASETGQVSVYNHYLSDSDNVRLHFYMFGLVWNRAVPELRRLVTGFPSRRPGFDPRSGHVGFVVDKVALGQVFSEYFGFHCRFSFHWLLHTHQLSSGAGTIGQILGDVPSGLSPTPPQETKKRKELEWNQIRSFTLFKYNFNSSEGAGIVQSIWRLATGRTAEGSEFESR